MVQVQVQSLLREVKLHKPHGMAKNIYIYLIIYKIYLIHIYIFILHTHICLYYILYLIYIIYIIYILYIYIKYILVFICIYEVSFFLVLASVFISPWMTPFCISGMLALLVTNSICISFLAMS